MAKHHLLGNAGELLALQWLQQRGFIILYRSWRHSHYEVDIIAAMENTLHFIEVKTRRNKKYGEPEESVSKKKIMNLMKAAEAFQYLYPGGHAYSMMSYQSAWTTTRLFIFILRIYISDV